jgi:DNA-binding CsgD family transcriptional regulator
MAKDGFFIIIKKGHEHMMEQLLNQFNLYIWAKDKSYRYIYVNENYAKAAGMDSPCQMMGKTDDEMPWRAMADDFKHGDFDVIKGASRIDAHEKTSTVNGITDILVSESRLVDNRGDAIGVKGSFYDITGKKIIKKSGYYDAENDRYYFGVIALGDIYLTGREMDVFRNVMRGWPAAKIGAVLKISSKTVETYIVYIRRKFGVSSKTELMTVATQHGLMHLLD